MDVIVRPVTGKDLDELADALGQRDYFADRLERQARGEGIVLAAWVSGQPVGDVYLWCMPAEEPEIREHLPGVPLLNHLEVHPEHQNRGIGTQLVAAAEESVQLLGHARVAIGVAVDNEGAHRLYTRLGYRDWGHGTVDTNYEQPLRDGGVKTAHEVINVLVKSLRAPSD